MREELRRELLSEKIFAKVGNSAKVTERRDPGVLRRQPQLYAQKASRDVRHILVTSKALADDLHAQLTERRRLRRTRQEVLDGSGLDKTGGKLTIQRGQTVPEFEKVAFALGVGELSKPVKTQFGWHIIEALSAEKAGATTP